MERTPVRLQKVIADAGLASRRKAEDLIVNGEVTVNGHVVRELGTKIDPARDHVKVKGKHIKPPPPQTFLMLNKPKGYLSELNDPHGRPTVAALLPRVPIRIFPVGRLDFDSEGLMLFTNHGGIAQVLLHPRYGVPKIYLVKVKGVCSEEDIAVLEQGVPLEEGRTSAAVVKKKGKAEANSWLELTIHEGRKHQVKRMLEAVGHPVVKLTRVQLGPLLLGTLAPGKWRHLTDEEANALRALVHRPSTVEKPHKRPRPVSGRRRAVGAGKLKKAAGGKEPRYLL